MHGTRRNHGTYTRIKPPDRCRKLFAEKYIFAVLFSVLSAPVKSRASSDLFFREQNRGLS